MNTPHMNGPDVRDRLGAPADKYPTAAVTDETENRKPAQATAQRGPGPHQSYVDNRTELDRMAAEREAEPRELGADVPKVEPVPEIPGLFKFSTPVRSRKAGGMIDQVLLNPPSARSLIQHGHFMKTPRREWQDPTTRLKITEETTTVDYSILAKHFADMSGLDVGEVEGLNGHDMLRASIKLQEMMYTLPPK